jgi:hypothetical protein
MLQKLHMDVAKIDQKFCTCCKCFRLMLQSFVQNVSSVSDVCLQVFFYLDVAYVSHICCKSMFQMFYLFQSYVSASVFMLQVVSVLSGSCICCSGYTHML